MDWVHVEEEALKAAKERLDKLAAEGTSPIPQNYFLSGRDTASLIMSRLVEAIPQMASRTLNLTTGEPIGFRLARGLLKRFTNHDQGNHTAAMPYIPTVNASDTSTLPHRSSWLSEVGFLRSLTRSALVNNLVVDTLEGQLITLFIVVAFILVFLIREWVVQQRPAINIPAAVEAQVALPAIEDRDRQPEAIPEAVDGGLEGPNNSNTEPPDAEGAGLQDLSDHDSSESDSGPVKTHTSLEDKNNVQASPEPEDIPSNEGDSTSFQQRPGMPDRGTIARAAEIRRTIEEQSRATGQDWPALKVFMDLWTRAGNRPGEVLRIIEEEGRSEELGWVIAAMGRLESIPVSTTDQSHSGDVLDGEQPSVIRDAPFNAVLNDNEAAASDLSQRIYGTEYDLNKSLIAGNKFNDTSTDAGQESSVPVEGTDANGPINAEGLPANTNETDLVVEPLAQHSLDRSTQTTNNPFHPDYAGPLPPHPREAVDAEPHPPTVNVIDMNTDHVEHEQPIQAANGRPPPTGGEPTQSIVEEIMTWLWGEGRPGAAENGHQQAADDEHVVQDLANEAPFVAMEHGQLLVDEHEAGGAENDREGPVQDPQAVAEVVEAGLDPNEAEAVEDVEDLEGVMELVGMQGPIAGLIQNGMFCAVLVSLTIFLAIWIPYIMGKLFLIILANPSSLLLKLPLRWASATADLLSDTFIFSLSCGYYWVAKIINFLCSPIKKISLISRLLYGEEMLADVAKGYAERSLERLMDAFTTTSGGLSESDIPTFSIVAHESLQLLQYRLSKIPEYLMASAIAVCSLEMRRYIGIPQLYQSLISWQTYWELAAWISYESHILFEFTITYLYNIAHWLASLRHMNFLRLNMIIPQRDHPLDFSLAYWDTKDRALAIILGYTFFAILGILYLRLSRAFQGTREIGKVEGVLADVLYQAGGVMKVILIISIEMIVFPLYCGVLLDVALLPLFRHVTILSRLEFMVDSPYTSLFVHWFVGTCYMFHFALFVSMCRKIMRSGVLYFIRDPDDPTFHPVRDVLERSVFTQLCKIAFSALVYGGLVIICLGGVVWGIASAFEGVFPIHWSSNEPVLEFPVDLLFYNFLMPLAVKLFRPSDWLTRMYAWWFRKCARGLRLSHFLFGEKREDEEGHHVRRTWKDVFARRKYGDTKNAVIGEDRQQLAEDRKMDAFFLRDGRYVRTPASDQVRIPKGAHTFVAVDEAGNRADGQPENDQGLHGRKNEQFSTIYIPPHFRLRIGTFILLLWLFAAATGICITVVPLVFGRYMFSHVFPSHPCTNDVYAFSIGINLLGGALFVLLNTQRILEQFRQTVIPSDKSTALNVLHETLHYTGRLLRVLYTYTAFAVLLPSLFALIMEFYFIAPLHTYFSKDIAGPHTIYFIQDWTLGVLYVKMIGRLILWNEQSRPAIALRNIIQNGWTDPDARLATRGFIFPATLLMVTLLLAPLGLGRLAVSSLSEGDEQFRTAIYRYSYPGVLGLGIGAVLLYYAAQAFQRWKRRIRDEVYLIGERLHNFTERRTPNAVGGTRVAM